MMEVAKVHVASWELSSERLASGETRERYDILRTPQPKKFVMTLAWQMIRMPDLQWM
jgi:hypothetical protein